MGDEAVAITWADAEEKARVERLTERDPPLKAFFDGGLKDAVAHVLPGLGRGELGRTAAAIDAYLGQRVRFFLPRLRREMGANEDQCFLYRAGFLAAARAGRDRFVAQLAAIEKAADPAALLTAGLSAAAEAVGMTDTTEAAPPTSVPHVLALGQRRVPASGPPGALSSYLAGQRVGASVSQNFGPLPSGRPR